MSIFSPQSFVFLIYVFGYDDYGDGMSIKKEISELDVEDSMAGMVDLLMKALDEVENTRDTELLMTIKSKVDEAEDYYWRPIDSTEFYERLSSILREMGHEDDANEYLKRVGIIESTRYEILGKIWNFIGNNTLAYEYYSKAVELWPENSIAKKGMERTRKRIEKAKKNLDKLSSRKDTKGRLDYISALLDLGIVDRAREEIEKINGDDFSVKLMKARIMAAENKWEDAMAIAEELKKIDPGAVNPRRIINYARFMLGDEEDIED